MIFLYVSRAISLVDSGQIVSNCSHGGVSNADEMGRIRARANSVLRSRDIIIVKRTSLPQRPDLLSHHCSPRRPSTLQLPKYYDLANLAGPRRAPSTMQEVDHIPGLVNDEHMSEVGREIQSPGKHRSGDHNIRSLILARGGRSRFCSRVARSEESI